MSENTNNDELTDASKSQEEGICCVVSSTGEKCDRPTRGSSHGMCNTHVSRWYRKGDVEADIPIRTLVKVAGKICSADGCDRDVKTMGLCVAHYSRLRRRGDVQADIPIAAHGGGHTDDNGYRRISRNGRVYREHRLIMQEILGRELLPEENVHHKNGDRLDNRPENLELWSTSQPQGQRVSDKLAWAWEMIKLYEGKIA